MSPWNKCKITSYFLVDLTGPDIWVNEYIIKAAPLVVFVLCSLFNMSDTLKINTGSNYLEIVCALIKFPSKVVSYFLHMYKYEITLLQQ